MTRISRRAPRSPPPSRARSRSPSSWRRPPPRCGPAPTAPRMSPSRASRSPTTPGRPQLPERIVTLAVPPGADVRSARLRILEADTVDLPGRHAVAPAPPAATWVDGKTLTEWGAGRKIRDGKDLGDLRGDAPWPRAPLALERSAGLGGLPSSAWSSARSATARPRRAHAHPPRRRGGRVRPRARGAPQPPARAAAARAPCRGRDRRDLGLVNAARARAWSDGPRGTTAGAGATAAREAGDCRRGADGPEQAAYLIVAAKATVAASAALAEFVAHKAARGLAVKVVTEDDFGAATAGRQRAAAIRDWLQANAPALGARYLLLVGDPHPESGDVPMLRAWPRRGATTNTSLPRRADGRLLRGPLGLLGPRRRRVPRRVPPRRRQRRRGLRAGALRRPHPGLRRRRRAPRRHPAQDHRLRDRPGRPLLAALGAAADELLRRLAPTAPGSPSR